jgi:glutaconate CoA-transferase subunit B
VTDQAVLEPDPDTGELVLAGVYPGVDPDAVRSCVGWELRARPTLASIEPPTPEELRLLREVLDPRRIYLKG